jgi:uncharacterized lipoprotein
MSFTQAKFSFVMLATLLVTGCGGISIPKIESDKIDYKSAQQLPPLEVPPDLARPAGDDRFAIPAGGDAAAAEKPIAPAQATLLKGEDGNSWLLVKDPFDRAWRRVGLALDRGGFTVEDRDRNKGIFRIQYSNVPKKTKEPGFFSKLLGFGDAAPPEEKRYQILVKENDDGSAVSVLDADGNPDKSEGAGRVLSILYEQLK